MVRLVRVMFGDGNIPEEIDWVTMVLLPKGKGDYWGIGLVEVLWKVRSVVVNCCLKRSVMFHGTLHGFRERLGTGTATLEAKIAHQLNGIEHEPLFQFFLDVLKAYDFMDRGRCLKILREYGLGTNLDQLLKNYWKQQRIFPKAGKCLGTAFDTGRGVTQGYPEPHMIFNIVVDAVVQMLLDVV